MIPPFGRRWGLGARHWELVLPGVGAVAEAFDQIGHVIAGAWRSYSEFWAITDDLAVGFGDLTDVFTVEDLVTAFDLGAGPNTNPSLFPFPVWHQS